MSYTDWHESGFKVIGIHPMLDGDCTCPRGAECFGAGKHPRAKNWQHTPEWSDEQLQNFDEIGYFNAYGILCDGYIVIDVDARNGGVEAYTRLLAEIPSIAGAGCIVNTGSGNGSMHLFFKAPMGVSFQQHHENFKGIDFKTSGFVVGYGSPHKSGNFYELAVGSPSEIDDAPKELVELLKVRETRRASLGDSEMIDISNAQLIEILNLLSPDCDYDTWIKSGMAVHNATGGSADGLKIWDDWSSKGKTYFHEGEKSAYYKWHTFGKSSSQVTIGTLISISGWRMPVTFQPDAELLQLCKDDVDAVDLLRPHGLVGEIAAYINSTSLYKRERLSVHAALCVVSACGGMRHRDKEWDVRSNMFLFGVAASSTGKDHIYRSAATLMRSAGIEGALSGNIKSEQEIYRNLLDHQAALYGIDEIGEVLGKITSGKASYMEGVVGQLMTLYSSSNGYHTITGDNKREQRELITKEIAALNKQIDAGKDCAHLIKKAEDKLAKVDSGLFEPFVQIQGFTTPDKFEAMVTTEMVTSGFFARAFIAKETDDNPRRNKKCNFDKTVPEELADTLSMLYMGGYCDMQDSEVSRKGNMIDIPLSDKASSLRDEYAEKFQAMADDFQTKSQLTAIPRRGAELMMKVALTLGMNSGVISEQDMRYAYAFVCEDIKTKTHIAGSNGEKEDQAILHKIMSAIPNSEEEAMLFSVLKNKCCRNKLSHITPDEFLRAIEFLSKSGHIIKVGEKRYYAKDT